MTESQIKNHQKPKHFVHVSVFLGSVHWTCSLLKTKCKHALWAVTQPVSQPRQGLRMLNPFVFIYETIKKECEAVLGQSCSRASNDQLTPGLNQGSTNLSLQVIGANTDPYLTWQEDF